MRVIGVLGYYLVWSLVNNWSILRYGSGYLPMRYPRVVWNMSIVVSRHMRYIRHIKSDRVWSYIFPNNPAIYFYVPILGVNGKTGIQSSLSPPFTYHTNASNRKHGHNTN